jgi:membrane protein DedA with SNARE-associated domain
MVSIIDFIIVFAVSLGFNLIPFAGPSNLLIASNAALTMANPDPATLLLIGLIVAFASALAKGVHYMVTFFVSGHLGEKRRQKLDTDAAKIKRWAFPLLFIVAATPVPDEPVVIPLGLMKYNPAKFFGAYFLGKLTIAVAGAFLGNFAGDFLSAWFTPTQTLIFSIVFSIVLTVVVTVALFKVDWEKLQSKFIKPKKQQNPLNQVANQ